MNVEKYNRIKLSDNHEYVVVSKVNYETNNYLYLVDIADNSNIKICIEKKENELTKLIDIEDATVIQKLIPIFANDVKDILEQVSNH